MTKAILQHSTSRSLIAGLRVRDIKSWAVLGELYGPVVLSWCRRTGLDDADAHDVAQEVILRVMERIGNFHRRSDSDRFRNWLKTICKNEVIRFCEKKQR
ncbi:MAG: sigma factor, partial [Planctomycetota bacterium]